MKFIITAALLVLAGGAHGYEVGDTVEDFTLPDLEGIEVSLGDHVGEIIVLNFFTTWCTGCNEEAAHLEDDIWLVYADQGVTNHIWMAPDWNPFYQFPQSAGIPYNAVLDKNLVIRYA